MAKDQRLAEEQRRRFEERAKAMEVEEIEATADPGAGPHIETKKRKRAGSGFTILGTRVVGSTSPVFGDRTTKRYALVIFASTAKFLVQWTWPTRRWVRQRR